MIIGFQFIYTQITNREDFITNHYPEFLTHYQKERIDYSPIITFLKKENFLKANLLIGADFESSTLLYLIKLNSIPITLQIPFSGLNWGAPHDVHYEWEIFNADYVFFFDKFIGDLPRYEMYFKKNFDMHSSEFSLVFSHYDDGYNATFLLYKRIKNPEGDKIP